MRQRPGTKSDQNLAKGHVLFQRHLGTAAMPIKGGTQEAKFQRLLSLDLHATQKRLERPEGEEGRRNWHRACRNTGCERKRRIIITCSQYYKGGLLVRHLGVPKIRVARGTVLGLPIIRIIDLGSILGSPYFGKLPFIASCMSVRENIIR